MKVRKVKQMLIAALVVCAGILVSNAGAVVASGEKEFSLLPPVFFTGLSATPIAVGQTLANSTISGTAIAVGIGEVAGTFAWDSPTTVPSISDRETTLYALTFTPTDPNHSKVGTATLNLPPFVVSGEKEFVLLPPVTLTGLSATAITCGQTLADSTISGTAATTDFGDVVGTFTWDSPATVPGLSDSQTTPYAITFTPTDPNHSKTGTTTLTLTVEKSERQKAMEETFPEPTYEVTGPDADGVYTVTLTEDVIGPVMIRDNLGKIKIDLDGHTITGPAGATGSATEAGANGESAIVVYHDTAKSGEPTELSIADSAPDAAADIIGGNGGDGNPPGNGAPAIKVNGDVQPGVTLEIGEQVDIQGGKGGNALGVDADGNGVPGGQGGAGVDGNVKSNDGTITGGAGGNGSDGGATGGNGGNGGAGVTGTEGPGTGTTTGGNGGNGGTGDKTGGNGGQGGAGNGNEPATGTGGNGGQGGDGGETGGNGGQGGAGDPAGLKGDDGTIVGGRSVVDGSIVIVGIDPAEDDKWAVSFTLTLKEGAPQFATWLDNTANAGKIKLAVAASEAGLGEATSVEVSNVRVTGENTATVDGALAERDLNLFKVVIEE